MDDYYSLLGIDADASVDDIRGAYRERKDGLDTSNDVGKADAAQLNKAWNVLSDPYQRGRYDEQRAIAEEKGDLDAADESAVVSANGRGVTKSARATGGGNTRQSRSQSLRDERNAKLRAAATITPPAGTHWPETKPRILAMVIDLLIIVVLLSACQFGAQSIARSQKPEVVDRIDAINDQITAQDKIKSDADTAVNEAKKANDTEKQAAAQKTSDAAKQKVKDLTKERDEQQKELNGYFLAGIALASVLGLLYLVIPTAITGRTLGKRVQHLKVLREDGSPVGWGGAITRFGPLVLITFVLSYVQQIFAVLVLFGVTMWMRNPNMQGLHDRFAHTIVVSDAPPKPD